MGIDLAKHEYTDAEMRPGAFIFPHPMAYLEAVREMVKEVQREGRDGTTALPSDLRKHGLLPWTGSIFGCVCVASPIVLQGSGDDG